MHRAMAIIVIRIDPMNLKPTRGSRDRDHVHGPLHTSLAHYCNDARQHADTFILVFSGKRHCVYNTPLFFEHHV